MARAAKGEGALEVGEIHRRLARIFPEEIDPRNFVRRLMAARTVFVLLYGEAIEGAGRWIRPTAVADMCDAQAARQAPADRMGWLDLVQSPRRPREVSGRWYGENTREPIRDETLRALVGLGAVMERPGLPTTSPQPRYSLRRDFADLFAPELKGKGLERRIEAWQAKHLTQAARARIALGRQGVGEGGEGVLVALPGGERRRLAPGPSATLTRAVIEDFAPRFLRRPAVVFVTESARKISYQDDRLCQAIGLTLEVSGPLPDLLLADLGTEPLSLLFVECVVTDGAIDERRRGELAALARDAGFREEDCRYLTAFPDRARSPFRKLAPLLAWGSYAWFASEPDHLVVLVKGEVGRTVELDRLLPGALPSARTAP